MAKLNWTDVIEGKVSAGIRGMYVHIPAKVTNVADFSSLGIIDVLPCVADLLKDGSYMELPPILDVPVVFPSAGGGILSFPIAVGDTVLLAFTDRGLEEWKDSDGTDKVYYPRTRRNSALADAVAFPGMYSEGASLKPDAADVVLKFKGSSIKILANGDIVLDTQSNVTVTTGGDANVTASGTINYEAPTINLKGNVIVDGEIFHGAVNIGALHTHVIVGGGSYGGEISVGVTP